MQISCPKCKKTFNLDNNLIPDKGRLLQCGKCKNKWFYKRKLINQEIKKEIYPQKAKEIETPIIESNVIKNNLESNYIEIEKKKEPNKIVKKNNTNYVKIFFVAVISAIAIIVLIDTFKLQISLFFPQIESILNNLYETLKDIYLFIKDFIN